MIGDDDGAAEKNGITAVIFSAQRRWRCGASWWSRRGTTIACATAAVANAWRLMKAWPVRALDADGTDLVALDDALKKLEKHDARKAKVVSLRYFAGLSVEETAEVLELSPATVKNDWAFARAWLHRELTGDVQN